MAIVHLGAKRLQGTKLDRKVDSLGSSADGTNSGIKNPNYSSNGLEFTGGDYVEVNGLRSTISGATSISMACWINPSDIADATILGFWNSGYEVIIFSINGSNKLQLVTKGANGSNLYMASSASISADTLTHVAFTYDTSGTDTVKLYINGALDSTHTSNVPTSFPSSSTGNVYIGSHSAGTNYFDGTIKQYLVYSDVLTLTEIQTLYNSGTPVTSPSTSGLVSRYDFTANANDSQGSNNGTSSAIKLGTGAYSFGGGSDVVILPYQVLPTSGDYTIAGWARMTSASASNEIIRSSDSSQFELWYSNNNGIYISGASGSVQLISDSDVELNKWYHFAFTHDSSGDVSYVDGVSTSTATLKTPPSATSWRLGNRSDESDPLYGQLDDWGVWHRALTATEIGKLANNNLPAWGASEGQSAVSGNTGSGSITFADNKCRIQSATYTDVYAYGLDMGVDITGDYCLDFEFVMNSNTYVSTGQACGWILGLSVANSAPSGENPSHANYEQIKFNSYTSGNPYVYVRSKNASGTNDVYSQEPAFTLNSSTAETRYGRIVRDGTTYKLSVYDNSGRTSQVGSDVSTTTNASQNVRYLYIKQFTQNSSNTWDFSLDNIKLYNGQTSATGSVTKTVDFTQGAAQLVSSLTNKSELKANYTMDSTVTETLKSSADLTDDFSSDTWTGCKNSACDNGAPTTIDISSGALRASTVNTASDDRLHKALGFTLSNSKWTCQFEVTLSSSNQVNIIALTDGSGNLNAADGLLVDYASSKLKMISYNGSSKGLDSTGITTSTGTNYFVTLTRTSETGLKLDVRTGSHTGTLVGSETGTISSSTIDLDTVQSGAYGRQSGDATYVLDNLKIYNNSGDLEGCKNDFSSTSDLEAMTNLPVNTIFEQTDDTPSYWGKQSDNTWKLDGKTNIEPSLTDSSVCSMVGNQSSATTSLTGGKLRINQATNSGSNTDSGCVALFDTGSGTDKFVIRFNFTTGSSHTDGGGNAVCYWGLSSNSSYSSSQGFVTGQNGNSADCVAFRWHIYSNKTRVGSWDNGSLTWGTDPNENLTFTDNTTYYWELSYDGTSAVLKRFTDSTYTNPAHTGTYTLAGRTGMRYFIMGDTYDTQAGVFIIDHNKIEIQKGRSTWLE